jgi:ubiquitin-conjugating enzyme E2 J1
MAPSPTIRRLLKETAELSSPTSSPNPAFFAAPVSEADLHEWHFTLLGPPAPSPYAGGLYHGRITLPPTYPLKPPNFRFLTPSGRFEVNREICLSISGFHEETWMPAWGVRTALTALRSFMAERGSAGQVGGLEASPDVRKRLAAESRAWRCDACGGRTNEAVMRDWWAVCREAGLAPDEEHLGLDALPDGLSLEARESGAPAPPPQPPARPQEDEIPAAERQTGQDGSAIPSQSQPQPQPPPATSATRDEPGASPPPSSTTPDSSNTTLRHPPSQTSAAPFPPTPSAEAAQASAEAVLTPSDLSLGPAVGGQAPPPRHPMMSGGGIHAAPLAAANAAVGGARPLLLQRDRGRAPTTIVTVDRAIAGVFLALCLMVLKKIFHPAGGGGPAGGVDDFYLQRE